MLYLMDVFRVVYVVTWATPTSLASHLKRNTGFVNRTQLSIECNQHWIKATLDSCIYTAVA